MKKKNLKIEKLKTIKHTIELIIELLFLTIVFLQLIIYLMEIFKF